MKSTHRVFAAIMLAVLAWGTWLAAGAYRYNNNPWRAVVVLASVGIFLGGWLLLLANRHRSSGSSKRP
jgi:RsiW-degrading membrane proteinase PrsW (M82 family)